MQARIQSLWRYPVKSCSGESPKPWCSTLRAARWATGAQAVVNSAAELQWMGGLPRLTWVQAARWARPAHRPAGPRR